MKVYVYVSSHNPKESLNLLEKVPKDVEVVVIDVTKERRHPTLSYVPSILFYDDDDTIELDKIEPREGVEKVTTEDIIACHANALSKDKLLNKEKPTTEQHDAAT